MCCHPPCPLGILKVLILVLSVGFLRRYEQNRVVVQSQGDQPVVFEFLKIFIHGRLIVSKRSGGFLLPPRWRRYYASRRRFAFCPFRGLSPPRPCYCYSRGLGLSRDIPSFASVVISASGARSTHNGEGIPVELPGFEPGVPPPKGGVLTITP